MGLDDKRAYFDALSCRWDGFTDHDRVRGALRMELDWMALVPDEHVIDLGCGTGNLTAVLLEKLGPAGRVTAVDLSPAMIQRARAKLADPRIRWCVADAASLPLAAAAYDRVVCFSAWPHFPDQFAVLREVCRVLRPGGHLAILHIDGRARINEIHSSGGPAIHNDLLPPATDLAVLLRRAGFTLGECDDTSDRYCITATRTGS